MPTGLRRLADAFAGAPYCRTIGVEVARLVPDRARLRLSHRDDNGNRNGTLHGGVIASLIEMAGALAAATGAADRPARDARTLDLAVHYLAPALRDPLTADATVVRRGREIVFVTVDVASDTGAPIARGLAACRIGGRAHRAAGATAAGACPEIPDKALASARSSGSPFTRRLAVRVARLGAGHAVALLPHQPALAARDGGVHEGALAALADCAGGASAWSVGGFDARGRAATIGMHLTYDVQTRGEDVVAVASTPWCAEDILLNAVTLWGRDSGRALATGSVTYRIVRPRA